MMKCDKCSSLAVIFQKYSGMSLCQAHFEDDLKRKVRQNLRQSAIFGSPARISLALDGGQESASLLYILKDLFRERRDIELVGLMVDEGIDGQSATKLENARSLCQKMGVRSVEISFKEVFGSTIDDLAGVGGKELACRFCRQARDALLKKVAREIDANALATGQSLDDEALEVFQCLLQGDLTGLARILPRRQKEGEVLWIKPLMRLPAEEIAIYSSGHNLLPSSSVPCPHRYCAARQEAARVLEGFESRHPGTRYSLLRSLEGASGFLPVGCEDADRCPRCGEALSGDSCPVCRLLGRISGAKPLSDECI
jgi:uncharacterized protein (TIGR00269 family)